MPTVASDVDLIGDLPVFVISFCDGVGGALLACQQRTPDIEAHVVESDASLRHLVGHHFPRTTTDPDAPTMDVESLLARVDSAHWELLVLIGATPANHFPASGPTRLVLMIRGPAF